MKHKTKNLIYFILSFVLFVLPSLVHAQPGFTDDTNDVPLDGGLSLLLAAGVGYGVKKLRVKRRRI